jgi:hypothetical protein
MKYLPYLITAALLAGCATVSKPVPDDYKGPIAQLADTGKRESGSKGQFFAALEIDGSAIKNALQQTRAASYGKGPVLTPRYTARDIPARPMKVKLIGTHQTAAPFHEMASRMAGTFFSVEGVVDFTPKVGLRYVVTGALMKENSCVWIAESDSKQSVTEKVCTK